MDESTKKACFDEISHQICDADAKVNINDISSNWKVNLRDSERLLWQWHEEHKQQTVSKEFIVRGIDAQGHCVITVIKESQLPAIEKMLPKFSSSLFSLELPAKSSGNRLGTHQLSTSVVVNLPLDEKPRQGASSALVVPPAPKPTTSSNGLHKPAVARVEPKVEPKPITSNGTQKPIGAKSEPQPSPPKTSNPTVKPEPAETPTKQSPKKVSPKSGAASKAKPAAATGRAAISSFFSKPAARNGAAPLANGAAKTAATNANGVAAKRAPLSSPVDLYTKERLDTSSSGNEMSLDTPKAGTTKRAAVVEQPKPAAPAEKPTVTAAEKRKRALADLLDSDNDDDNDANGVIPPTPKQGNSKRKKTSTVSAGKKRNAPAARIPDPASDEDIPGTPQADVISGRKTPNASKTAASRVRQICDSSDEEMPTVEAPEKRPNKRKAKRTVTRTYEDEDGFIKTVKEIEEYTCSEDENTEQNVAKPVNGKPAAKVSSPKKAAAPTKITPPNKQPVKQGSIMNFFKKK